MPTRPCISLLLVALLLALGGLAAQAPVPPANAQVPGTSLSRCGLPLNPNPTSVLDHPDCDYGQTNPSATYAPTSLIRIPVVVHVIQSTSGQGNLSTALVQSQITVLNEDYRAIAGTAGAAGTDTRIEFFLATTDPSGNPTTGIMRHTNNTWFADSGAYYNSIAWPTNRYLNIYTNNAGNGSVLGYVPDLPQGGSVLGTNADRVVILYSAFGRPATGGAPYHLGRSCTHEVGHYLGLFHPFDFGCGSASCYTTGDRICDTNAEANPRFGCMIGASSCGSTDPVQNYMDYSDDSCMNNFTQEQARRMRCTLQHYRPQLGQPGGPIASSAVRTGAGNLNTAYSCTAPRLGQTSSAVVVLFGTPYSLASVYGYTGAATLPFQGFTILIDTSSAFVLQLPFAGGLTAVWNFGVPNAASLAGLPIKTQALLLGSTFALTNAVDLVVGN
jgi:hypothetical protein